MELDLTRRRFIAAAAALATLAATVPSRAAEEAADPAAARIQSFYNVLLETMKQATQLGIRGRYDMIVPALREAFDLAAMARIAVGPGWASFSPEQQTALTKAFERMTVAVYADRFDGYAGERFLVDPKAEARNAGRIVRTKLIPSDGEPVALNYLMRGSGDVWKATDVYLDGTISELATRRSEFAAILKSGGPNALIAKLQERGDQLLNG